MLDGDDTDSGIWFDDLALSREIAGDLDRPVVKVSMLPPRDGIPCLPADAISSALQAHLLTLVALSTDSRVRECAVPRSQRAAVTAFAPGGGPKAAAGSRLCQLLTLNVAKVKAARASGLAKRSDLGNSAGRGT